MSMPGILRQSSMKRSTAVIAQLVLRLMASAVAQTLMPGQIDPSGLQAPSAEVVSAQIIPQAIVVDPAIVGAPISTGAGLGAAADVVFAPAPGPWQGTPVPITAPAASPAPTLSASTPAVIPVTSQPSLNYNKTFDWAAPGEEWSIGRINSEVADMRATGPYNLVFYGDSILQCLRFEMPVCQGASKLTQYRFGKYKPYVLAVGNEKATSLMSRFLNGAVPTGINKDNLTAVVIMVGNNDIGRAGLQDRTAQKEFGDKVAGWLTEMIYYLLDQDPGIQVVPLSLLPATGSDGDYTGGSLYVGDVQVNQQLKYLGEVEPRIHYVDCVKPFLMPDNPNKANRDLIPDGTHPNVAGFEVLADCLEPVLDKILDPIIEDVEPAGSSNSTISMGITRTAVTTLAG